MFFFLFFWTRSVCGWERLFNPHELALRRRLFSVLHLNVYVSSAKRPSSRFNLWIARAKVILARSQVVLRGTRAICRRRGKEILSHRRSWKYTTPCERVARSFALWQWQRWWFQQHTRVLHKFKLDSVNALSLVSVCIAQIAKGNF